MKNSWIFNLIAYLLLSGGLLLSGFLYLFGLNPLYLVLISGIVLTLIVYTVGLITFKLSALVPLGTVDGKRVKLHSLKNASQFGPPLDSQGNEVKPETWYMLSTQISHWNKFLLMRMVKYRLVHEKVITPGEKSFGLDSKNLIKGENYNNYKFEPYEFALAQNETNWDIVGQVSQTVDKYITVGKVSTKTFWFTMICALVSTFAFIMSINPTISVAGVILIAILSLGYLSAFTGGLLTARKTKPFALNEEGTQIVRQGNAFKEYFESANVNGVYSLEQNDLEAKYLPWATAFNQESVWAYVFAVPGRAENSIMIHEKEVTHKDLGFVIRNERLAERIQALISGERWQQIFGDKPFVTNKN